MPARKDVTDIEWEPPLNGDAGPGEVTIEHTVVSDVNVPMAELDARRLADHMFGDDKTESLVAGAGVHWARGPADRRRWVTRLDHVTLAMTDRDRPMVTGGEE
jgi:hypothetical protein